MFNKDINKTIKDFELNTNNFYKQYQNISITPDFAIMLNKYYESKNNQDHIDFEEDIKSYLDKSFEYSILKQYDKTIETMYHQGKITIDNDTYLLKDFYLVYNDSSTYSLMCTDTRYHNEKCQYSHAVKFIDTTAFITLVRESNINNNTIIISDKKMLMDIIHNWDGLFHSETSKTEAINRKMLGNE